MTTYPDSYYAASLPLPSQRAAVAQHVRVDVAVVGCGYTGLSAALHLAESGRRVVALDAERVGYAASGRNGGQVHSGFNVEQEKLESSFGHDRAMRLWSLAERAKALVRERVQRHEIACAFRDGIFLAAHDGQAALELEKRVQHLETRYGYGDARCLSREETNSRLGTSIYYGGLYDRGGGRLNPLALALGLARAAEAAGATIFESSRVLSLQESETVTLRTTDGEVVADKAILACDAMMPVFGPPFSSTLANIESYLVATAPLAPHIDVLPRGDAVADTRRALDYYQLMPDRRLVFAGGETTLKPAYDIAGKVLLRMLRVFPQLAHVQIDHAWSGTVAITRTRLPHFGRLGKNVVFGYGYSGQGVALAVLGGRALAEASFGTSEDFELLASVPPKAYPFGLALRQPLAAAMVLALKIADLL
jgi:gamma-glutamylputrescine oxidase